MRIARLGLISFGLLFTVILVISLFIPSVVGVSRAKDLPYHPDSLRAYLANPAHWPEWFPGMEQKQVYVENGNPKGIVTDPEKNRWLVIDSVTATAVYASYRGWNKTISTRWTITPHKGSGLVTLQWYMEFRLKWYPWEKFASLLFEKSYGAMMEQGLENLKRRLEAPGAVQ